MLNFVNLLKTKDWVILGPFAAIGLGLAFYGYEFACPPTNESCRTPDFWHALLNAFTLIRGGTNFKTPDDPWSLVVAQFVLPAVALFGVAKIVVQNIRRDVRVVRAGRLRGHAIVCGIGGTGRQIVENLHGDGKPVVAITLHPDEPNAIACEQLGVTVLKGNARQVALLNAAGLRGAATLIATSGSDAVNIEIALRARDARAARKKRRGLLRHLPHRAGAHAGVLTVLPELRSQWLIDTIRGHRSGVLGSDAAEVRPFNLYVNAARLLLRSPAFERALPLAAASEPALVLAGFGAANSQILLHAVQNTFALPGQRLRALIFDQKGADSLAALQSRFPGLAAHAELSAAECSFDPDDPAPWDIVDTRLGELADIAAIVVALAEDDASLHTALTFRERLDRLGRLGTPVFVRLKEQHKLGEFAASLDGADLLVERFRPFGDLAYLTGARMLLDEGLDDLARAVHAKYLETVEAGDDPANVAWPLLPERFKESSRRYADHIEVELRHCGLRLVDGDGSAGSAALAAAEIEALAAMEHGRWRLERAVAGWTCAPKRDDIARQHPDLVGWAELDEATRERNRVAAQSIPEIAAAAGKIIRRDRIIVVAPGGAAQAAAEIAALAPGEQGILVIEAGDRDGWDLLAGETARGVKAWVRWRHGAPPPRLPPGLAGEPALRAVVEAWISDAELARCSDTRRSRPPPQNEFFWDRGP